eukprot:gene1403-7948_t
MGICKVMTWCDSSYDLSIAASNQFAQAVEAAFVGLSSPSLLLKEVVSFSALVTYEVGCSCILVGGSGSVTWSKWAVDTCPLKNLATADAIADIEFVPGHNVDVIKQLNTKYVGGHIDANKEHNLGSASVTFRATHTRNAPNFEEPNSLRFVAVVSFGNVENEVSISGYGDIPWPVDEGTLVFPGAGNQDEMFVQLFEENGNTRSVIQITLDRVEFYNRVRGVYGEIKHRYLVLYLAEVSSSYFAFKIFDTSVTLFDHIQTDSELGILTAIVDSLGLSITGSVTLFAPIDSGFMSIPNVYRDYLFSPAGFNDLRDIIFYHVLLFELPTHRFPMRFTAPTALSGKDIFVEIIDRAAYVDGIRGVRYDIAASNGVYHKLSGVLFPNSFLAPTIISILRARPSGYIFSRLLNALTDTDLIGTLSGPGPFTLFAPSDAAFSALPPSEIERLFDPDNFEDLTATLLYHAVRGKRLVGTLTDGDVLVTKSNDRELSVSAQSTDVFVQGATIVARDIEGENGVIHVIDRVLLPDLTEPLPDPKTLTILQQIEFTPMLSTLRDLLAIAELEEMLAQEDTSYTIFAPNDNAFASLPSSLLQEVQDNREKLRHILEHHIINGVLSEAVLKATPTHRSVNDLIINVQETPSKTIVENANILDADTVVKNGIIHIVDGVFLLDTIFDVLKENDEYSNFVNMVEETGFKDYFLKSGPLTIFALTNDAISSLSDGTVNYLLDTDNREHFRTILEYHIVPGRFVTIDYTEPIELKSLEGTKLLINGNRDLIQIDNRASIIEPNIQASNGVIQGINQMLIPEYLRKCQVGYINHDMNVFTKCIECNVGEGFAPTTGLTECVAVQDCPA